MTGLWDENSQWKQSVEAPQSQVQHKHVTHSDVTLSWPDAVTESLCTRGCVCEAAAARWLRVFLPCMNASPCCCAVRLSVNLWLIVAEEQARENQYKQAAFMLPVKHTDLPLQCVTSFSSFFSWEWTVHLTLGPVIQSGKGESQGVAASCLDTSLLLLLKSEERCNLIFLLLLLKPIKS